MELWGHGTCVRTGTPSFRTWPLWPPCNFQETQETTEETRSCAGPRQDDVIGKAPWMPFLFPFTSLLPLLRVSLPLSALPWCQPTFSLASPGPGFLLWAPPPTLETALVCSWPSGKTDVPSKPSPPLRPSCVALGKLHYAFGFPPLWTGLLLVLTSWGCMEDYMSHVHKALQTMSGLY